MASISFWYLTVFILNIAISIAAIIGFRYGMAALIGVHATKELDTADNFAFGITVAGGVLSLSIIMSAAISGEASATLGSEFTNVLLYAVTGVILLKAGLLIQDDLLLRALSLRDEIKAANMAAGIVVASNLLAVGLMIRSSFTWIEIDGLLGLVPVLVVFAASQIVLACVTFLRLKTYASRNPGKTWHQAIAGNNSAIAIRFAGQIIGTAIALTAVGSLVEFTLGQYPLLAATWLATGLVLMLVVWALYRMILPIVLSKIDVVEEVDRQGNIGIALIEAAIFIGVAILLLGFLSY